nr:MAG TPA: hypothetical protein [Caudoviricetes sp.]
MPTSTSVTKAWLCNIIMKMHSSDREDGCPINSGIVSIYYSSISNWELFIYKCIGIYKYCKYRINDTNKINHYM